MRGMPIDSKCRKSYFIYRVCTPLRDQILRTVGVIAGADRLDRWGYPEALWSNFLGLCGLSKPKQVAARSNFPIFGVPKLWHRFRVRAAPNFSDCPSVCVTEMPPAPFSLRVRPRVLACAFLRQVVRAWRQQHMCWRQPEEQRVCWGPPLGGPVGTRDAF